MRSSELRLQNIPSYTARPNLGLSGPPSLFLDGRAFGLVRRRYRGDDARRNGRRFWGRHDRHIGEEYAILGRLRLEGHATANLRKKNMKKNMKKAAGISANTDAG